MKQPTIFWEGPKEYAEIGLLVSLDYAKPHPQNPRVGDVRLVKSFLSTLGQVKPIVLDREGTVLAGHTVLKAATALGWTHIAAVTCDLEGEQALAYLLADNHASDVSGWNLKALESTVKELQDAGVKEIGQTWLEEIGADMAAITCPHCGHGFRP